MLGIAAALVSGCAVDTGEEEQAGESAEAFAKAWHTDRLFQTEEIKAPTGAVIRVTSKADDPDRARCKATTYRGSLVRFDANAKGIIHQSTEGIERDFPMNQPHIETWIGVYGGTYRVQFDTTKPKGVCDLRGVLTVEVTPPKQ